MEMASNYRLTDTRLFTELHERLAKRSEVMAANAV
jgi:hypothetical protein